MDIGTHPQSFRCKRERAIGRAVDRLDRQITLMQTHSNRLSNYRLVTFLIGITFLFLPVSAFKWIPATGAGILFLYWVVRHHRLHLRMKRYRIWRFIKNTNLARAQVRWNDIPVTPNIETDDGDGAGKDLELVGERSLHHLLDTSISERGSRRLASWLNCAEPDVDATRQRQKKIRELTMLPHFRDRLRLNFHLISKEKLDTEKMTKWLQVPPPKWNVKAAFWVSALLLCLSLGLFLLSKHTPLPAYWVFVYGMYLVLFISGVGKLAPVLESAQWLDDELSVFSRILLFLERYPVNTHTQLYEMLSLFQSSKKKPSRKIRSLKIAAACIGLRNNPIMTFLLNMFFPWDMLFAQWTLGQRRILKKVFFQWLDALSELEALNSLANFSYINPDYCYPVLSDSVPPTSPIFEAKSLGHPLINPEINVTNDYAIENIGDIALITGSNMAGKSTFLKTVGINLILAYCGAPVQAASFSTGFFRIRTCIKIEDCLADGISSFYAEVRRLRDILIHIRQETSFPVIYFIDEILRGTNNRERLIGSTALVRALTQTFSTGLISTHDLELTGMSTEYEQISNYHFAETIKEDKMFFSYKLRQGPCPTTNALHIMRKEGLPISV